MKVINNFVSTIMEEQNNLLMNANVGYGKTCAVAADIKGNRVRRLCAI